MIKTKNVARVIDPEFAKIYIKVIKKVMMSEIHTGSTNNNLGLGEVQAIFHYGCYRTNHKSSLWGRM